MVQAPPAIAGAVARGGAADSDQLRPGALAVGPLHSSQASCNLRTNCNMKTDPARGARLGKARSQRRKRQESAVQRPVPRNSLMELRMASRSGIRLATTFSFSLA